MKLSGRTARGLCRSPASCAPPDRNVALKMQEMPRGSQMLKSGLGFEMMVLCYGSGYERLHPMTQAAYDRAGKRRWSFTAVRSTPELLMKSVGCVQHAERVGASRLCSAACVPISYSGGF